MNRKGTYSVLVMLLTAASIGTMLYSRSSDYFVNTEYEPEVYSYIDYDDREYLGYIFNDYNKSVNLDYIDDVYKEPESEVISSSDISLSAMGLENTMENMRKLRSERKIEQRALKDESLKNSTADAMSMSGIGDFSISIELNDKIELLNLMRNLNQNEMSQLKKLFDTQAGEVEAKNILKILRSKLRNEEYSKLTSLVNKYRGDHN